MEERPSNHYNLSCNRVKSLQRRLLNDHDLLMEWDEIIKNQLHTGIIEKIAQEEKNRSTNVHYMPLFFKPQFKKLEWQFKVELKHKFT